ncbi:MAG: sigma-70 family RNA polymerase sigma factor [Planctomycetota bacterium]
MTARTATRSADARSKRTPINRLPKQHRLPADAKSGGRSSDADAKEARKERAAAVLNAACDFIDNPEFADRKVQKEILETPLIEEGAVARMSRRPKGLPNYLAGLYEVPLLTPKHEAALFRKMNFLKWKAANLREGMSPHRPSKKKLEECEFLLAEAKRTRNRIARCNLRLVVSIARKFADQSVSFDEFVSEGNVALMNAVAKFDYGRGFRFSTYATHAIRRAYYRMVQQRGRRNSRMVLGTGEIISESPHEHEERHLNEGQYNDFQRLMAKAAGELDERERMILTARFGLEESEGVQTLQVVAGQLGICKERVRQLQNRAIVKLRELAEEMRIEAPELVAPN